MGKTATHQANNYPIYTLMDWYSDGFCSIIESINTFGELDLWL